MRIVVVVWCLLLALPADATTFGFRDMFNPDFSGKSDVFVSVSYDGGATDWRGPAPADARLTVLNPAYFETHPLTVAYADFGSGTPFLTETWTPQQRAGDASVDRLVGAFQRFGSPAYVEGQTFATDRLSTTQNIALLGTTIDGYAHRPAPETQQGGPALDLRQPTTPTAAVSAVPEPGTLTLLASGIAGLWAWRRPWRTHSPS